MLGRAAVRRHRLGAVESVDGRASRRSSPASSSRRPAPGWRRAACCANGRTPTTSAPRTCGRSSGTFASVFPDATLWLVGDGDVLLVGIDGAARAAGGGPARALGRPARGRRRPGPRGRPRPFALISLLVAEGPGLSRFAGAAPLQTDDYAARRVQRPAHRLLARRRRQHRGAAGPGRRAAGARRDRGRARRPRPPRGGIAAGCCFDASAARGRPGPTSKRPCERDPHDARALRGSGARRRRRQPPDRDRRRAARAGRAARPDRGPDAPVAVPGLGRRRRGRRARGVRRRRAPALARGRPRAAGVGARRRPATKSAWSRSWPFAGRRPDGRRDPLLRGHPALPRRPRRPGRRRGAGARDCQPRCTPAAHNLLGAALAIAGRREAGAGGVPRFAQSRSRATRPPTPTSACWNSRAATATPASSDLPRP